jgi:peptide/nickel transport system substrate-binding protein
MALLTGVAFTLACGGPAATPIPTSTGTPEAANTLESPALQPTTVESRQSEQTGSGEGTIVIALSSEPENLNPVFMDFYSGNWKFFNGLISYDQDLNLVPDLAATLPEFSPDGKTVTVNLRDDVRFHDGEPLTAEDVVFTWQALANPSVGSELQGRFDLVNVLESVRATSEHSVEFTLKRTDPAFIHKLIVGIVPQHLLEGQDLNTTSFNQNPVGTGPYIFSEWRPGERIVMEANPDYFKEPANIGRVVFTFVEDESARVALIANGTIDATGLPPRLAAGFRGDDRFQVLEVPTADTRFIPLPNENEVLSDPRVRRAIAMSINRQAIIDGVLGGQGEPAYGPFILGAPAPEIPYDLEGAAALLEDAGWQKQSDGFFYKDGKRLVFTLMYPATDSVRQAVALAVRSELGNLGIDVNVEGLGWDAIRPRVDQGDANVFGWGQPYDPDLELWNLFHSSMIDDDVSTSNNAPRMRNNTIDQLLEAGRTELDPEKRREIYQQFQVALQEDGSWLTTVNLKPNVVMSSRIGNFLIQREGHAHGFSRGVSWNMERWTLQ